METITSRANERVKGIALLAESAGERRKAGLCVLDGLKLCAEASKRGFLRELWLTQQVLDSVGEAGLPESRETIIMTDNVLDRLSSQRAPQGAVGVADIPDLGDFGGLEGCRRVVVLCSVQDPVNVGATIRTAAGIGFDGVILCGDCADSFSPKALRASMGAAFAVKIVRCAQHQAVEKLKGMGFFTVAAALNLRAKNITETERAEKTAVFIGNEGHGLPDEIADACDVTAYIPITDAVESLNANAAAAIAMWEMRG